MFKKLFTFCLVAAFSISLIYSKPVLASESNTFSDEAIVDLFNQTAENSNGISEDYALLKSDSGTTYKVAVFPVENTAQFSRSSTGVVTYTQSYVLSTEKDYMQLMASGGQSTDIWDNSYSVHAYLTNTYQVNGSKYLLTNVSGQWIASDSTVTISDRQVVYSCSSLVRDQWYSSWLGNNSFSINTGFSNYIDSSIYGCIVGSRTKVQLSHGSSSKWSLEVNNIVINNGWGDPIVWN